MPWHIQQGGGSCGSSQYAVIKDSDGSTAGCHDTKKEAEAQMAALYANEPNMNAQQAGEARAESFRRGALAPVPAAPGRRLPFAPNLQVRKVERDGQEYYHLHGTATVYEKLYEMWDIFGPYSEGVRVAAGAESLAADPDVAFLANHEGLSLARTKNNTLDLAELDAGLDYDAYLNPKRSDVANLVTAVADGTIDESSFAFRILDGEWNDDFTEYWIKRYDINRGDVSAVNYGASPWTSVAARQQTFLADLDRAPAFLAHAALQRLQHRPDFTPAPVAPAEQTDAPEPGGMNLELARALFEVD